MRTLSVIATTLLLCSTLFASQTDPLWEKYINARMKYQDDVATLLAETHSELKELIAINHDL